ncbi:MAG: hypothetical protein LBS11_11690 [Oscillospiraceae bacterium]|jgi:hypothetical protein|nr:hypothetical protein [Oscillospiraceae bacterium]
MGMANARVDHVRAGFRGDDGPAAPKSGGRIMTHNDRKRLFAILDIDRIATSSVVGLFSATMLFTLAWMLCASFKIGK